MMIEWMSITLIIGVVLFGAALLSIDFQEKRRQNIMCEAHEIKSRVPYFSKERQALIRAGLVHPDGRIVINEHIKID